MKAEDYKVGITVYTDGDRYSEMKTSSLPNEDGNVICKFNTTNLIFNIKDLIIVDHVAEKATASEVQIMLNNAADAFQKAFSDFESAKDLANEYSLDIWELKNRGLLDFSRLEGSINASGWSMSSLRC